VEIIPTTLDPGQTYQRTAASILQLTGGKLTTPDPDGKGVGMGLAESVTPSDTHYIVKLKPGLKFSDGSELTSQDVIASFEYFIADKTNGLGYSYEAIKNLTAVDDLTVDFELKHPSTALMFYMSQPQSAILPSESIASRGKQLYEGVPIPTAGQFQVESMSQDQITLQANPNYAGTQPSTKTVVFKKIVDPAARLAQLQGGQIDFADTISPKQVGQLSDPVKVDSYSTPIGAYHLSLNTRANSILSDVRIRRAIADAIDRKQINEVAYAGLSEPALGIFGGSSKFYEPFLSENADVAGAQKLLADTKCESECSLKIIAPSDNDALGDTAIVVQQNLKAIGINAEVAKTEAATLNKWSADGNFDIRVGGVYDVGDFPDGYLAFSLLSEYGASYTGYSSPEMDKLIGEVGSTSGAAQTAATHSLNAVFENDLPVVPTVGFTIVSASRVPADVFKVNANTFYSVG